jgi:ribosomal protein S17E
MNVEIKTKEFDISNDDQPKMARVGDYWSKKKTTDIVDLLKEYQDVFSRDYKYLKGLVEEMGEMKIKLIPGKIRLKNDPIN